MGTQLQVPQSNLSNNEGKSKKIKYLVYTKWKHINRKHGFGHVCFKNLAMKDTKNLQKCFY